MTIPACKVHGPMELVHSDAIGPAYYCQHCGNGAKMPDPEEPTAEQIEDIIDRARSKDKLEKLVVAEIKADLEKQGYKVLVVGQKRAKGSGSTDGTPDMLVSGAEQHGWPAGLLLGLEVKRPVGGKISKAQLELINVGAIVSARSAADAWKHVRRLEEEIKK